MRQILSSGRDESKSKFVLKLKRTEDHKSLALRTVLKCLKCFCLVCSCMNVALKCSLKVNLVRATVGGYRGSVGTGDAGVASCQNTEAR